MELREAGPRYQIACACINCCQRADWTIAQGRANPNGQETRAHTSVVGNSIVSFTGIEKCKVWKLSEKSPIPFVCCKICFSEIFEIVPDFLPEAFNVPASNGAKYVQSDFPINETSTRISGHNNDLDPKYDPERKNTKDVYKGKGPIMGSVHKMQLPGLLRSCKASVNKLPGD